MVLIADRGDAQDICDRLSGMGERAYRIGFIEERPEGEPSVLYTGSAVR